MIRSYPKFEINKKILEKKEWKEFWIGEVFDEIKRGKRHIEKQRKKGNISYYSASKNNNGLTDFISNPKFVIEKNAIIYSTFGDAYFAHKNFTASDEIAILMNKKINLFNGLFLCVSLNQNKIKYSFGRKAFINKIQRDKILLPVKNNKLDFEYMEQFIKELEKLKIKKYSAFIQDKLKNLKYKEIPKLEEIKWKEFGVNELFNIKNSKPYHKKDLDFSKKELPYITRTNLNNGVEDLVKKDNKLIINSKNSIVFGAENAKFFFEPFEYITGNKMYVVTIKNLDMNKFNGLFLITVFNKSVEGCGFGYGQGLTATREKRRKILLPVKNNQPDFEYMEQFIKNIIIKKYLSYKLFK